MSSPKPRFVMPRQESALVARVRRGLIAIACIHLALATWGMYRRIWQILRIELAVSSTSIAPVTTAAYDVVCSGEAQNRILLELVQGKRTLVLDERRAAVNRVNTYDPRVFRYKDTIAITKELLQGFEPGPATLRLTGFGGQKLMRVPPPRVREIAVTIQ